MSWKAYKLLIQIIMMYNAARQQALITSFKQCFPKEGCELLTSGSQTACVTLTKLLSFGMIMWLLLAKVR